MEKIAITANIRVDINFNAISLVMFFKSLPNKKFMLYI